jgi:hypothetical protein
MPSDGPSGSPAPALTTSPSDVALVVPSTTLGAAGAATPNTPSEAPIVNGLLLAASAVGLASLVMFLRLLRKHDDDPT